MIFLLYLLKWHNFKPLTFGGGHIPTIDKYYAADQAVDPMRGIIKIIMYLVLFRSIIVFNAATFKHLLKQNVFHQNIL